MFALASDLIHTQIDLRQNHLNNINNDSIKNEKVPPLEVSSCETFIVQVNLPKSLKYANESEVISIIFQEFWKNKINVGKTNFFVVDSKGLKVQSWISWNFPENSCCLISSNEISAKTSTEKNHSNSNSQDSSSPTSSLRPHFGIMIHDLKILKIINHSTIIISISFTPFLFRSSPLSAFSQQQSNNSHNNNNIIVDELLQLLRKTQKFVALNHDAAELGIGEVISGNGNKNSSCLFFDDTLSILSGIIVPSLDQIRILGCGLDFPVVDHKNRTISTFDPLKNLQTLLLPSRENEARNHLLNLRKWVSENIIKKNNFGCCGCYCDKDQVDGDDDKDDDVPLWLIPKDPKQVQFWCAISYHTTFFKRRSNNSNLPQNKKNIINEIDEREEKDSKSFHHFLVPSSMILFSSLTSYSVVVDARFGSKIPPQYKDQIQEDLFYNFLDRTLFSSSTSISSSIQMHLLDNETYLNEVMNQNQEERVDAVRNSDNVIHHEFTQPKIQEDIFAPKRRGRVAKK